MEKYTHHNLISDVESLFKECLEIMKKKNTDYATDSDPFSNFRNSQVVGVSIEKGILVRIMDKISRISNVLDKGGVTAVDENIESTILDAINYFGIILAYIKTSKKEQEYAKGMEKRGS